MSLPGYTGDSSVYRSSVQYQAAVPPVGAQPEGLGRAGSVTLAWGIDCYPMCVIFAEARCRHMCPPHSIDCLPICILLAENRCRHQCGVLSMLS